MYVRTYVCMYVRTYVCMCVCMYVCMCVCMYVHTHVCMYVCMYACIIIIIIIIVIIIIIIIRCYAFASTYGYISVRVLQSSVLFFSSVSVLLPFCQLWSATSLQSLRSKVLIHTTIY